MNKKFTHLFSRLFSLAIFAGIAFQGVAQNEIPDGYYEKADGKAGAELKTALYNIIKVGKRLSYGSGTWTGFEKTDKHPDGYVWDMYSYEKRYFPGNGNAPGGMNIEHSVAKSWWGGSNNDAYKDLYHLNPSDMKANSARSNYPLGIVKNGSVTGSLKVGNNSYGNEYSGKAFEPLDEYKGDFARAYLYMFTCYENYSWTSTSAPSMIIAKQTYPMLKPWAAKMLLEWSEMDPPSSKEMNRAAEIYKIQNNRNPFIDYPELVEYLWGDKAGEPFYFTSNDDPKITSPSNNASFTMPETHYTSSSTLKITIKAKNLTSPLVLSLDGTKKELFAISDTYINPSNGEVEKEITISYHPTKAEELNIKLIIDSQNNEVDSKSINIKAVATEDFYALNPENVTSNSFVAKWTPISSTNIFELDVFTKVVTGDEEVLIIEEEFNKNMGQGWSVTSDSYHDFQDNGSIRLASGSKPGILSSPKLDLSKSGKVIVNAKVYGSDKEVVLTVKLDGTVIDEIDLNSTFTDYLIEFEGATTESVLTFSTIKDKRLYISNIEVSTLGMTIENKSENGYPKTVSNATEALVSNLKAETTYYYTVKPLNSDIDKSGEILVNTSSNTTGNDIKDIDNIKIFSANKTIVIVGLNKDDKISVYTVAGNLLIQETATTSESRINLDEVGVYIINIENNRKTKTYKTSLYN